MRTRFRLNRPSVGFTLIELLTVIAIIGIVASLIFPVLSSAKQFGNLTSCINNKKQLMLAWSMYAGEHQDILPGDHDLFEVFTSPDTWDYPTYNWISGPMNWTAEQQNTNAIYATHKNSSQLAPYLSVNKSLFTCPSDKYLSPLQKELGWSRRIRSVSMNYFIGPDIRLSFRPGGYHRLVMKNKGYGGSISYVKSTQIVSPSERWVLIDTHPDSVRPVSFYIFPPSRGNENRPVKWFKSMPASFHNGGIPVSFADGHIEYHKWQAAITKQPVFYDLNGLVEFIKNLQMHSSDQAAQADFRWLSDRAHDGTLSQY